jgi:hypothetical protein
VVDARSSDFRHGATLLVPCRTRSRRALRSPDQKRSGRPYTCFVWHTGGPDLGGHLGSGFAPYASIGSKRTSTTQVKGRSTSTAGAVVNHFVGPHPGTSQRVIKSH